jgi:hypothetical protein
MSSTTDTQRLATLIELKLSLLERLLELGQAQLDQIDTGDYNELLKLLSVKQRVLGGLQDVESALVPFRDQDPNARAWPTMSERRECQMQAARCEEILQQLLTQEQVSETRMIQRRHDHAHELSALHQQLAVQQAYVGQTEYPASDYSQLDLASEG